MIDEAGPGPRCPETNPKDSSECVLEAGHPGHHLSRDYVENEQFSARVNAACAEIGREVGYRRSCYPKWVQQGRMKPDQASEQIAALEDAATLLRLLSGVSR